MTWTIVEGTEQEGVERQQQGGGGNGAVVSQMVENEIERAGTVASSGGGNSGENVAPGNEEARGQERVVEEGEEVRGGSGEREGEGVHAEQRHQMDMQIV